MRHHSRIDIMICSLNLLLACYVAFDQQFADLINNTTGKVAKDDRYFQSADYHEDYKTIIYPFKILMGSVIGVSSILTLGYSLLHWNNGQNNLLRKINAFISALLLGFVLLAALLAPVSRAYIG